MGNASSAAMGVSALVGSGWFNLALWAIAIIVALVIFRWQRQRTAVEYLIGDETVIGIGDATELASRMTLSFDGQNVPRVTITSVALWNSGDTTIDGAALGTSDPLRIVVPATVAVLQSSVVACSQPVVQGVIAGPTHTGDLLIQFDYLDARQAVIVEVVHTGQAADLQLAGRIKGIPAGIRKRKPSGVTSLRLLGITAAIMLVATGGPLVEQATGFEGDPFSNPVFVIANFAGALVLGYALLLSKRATRGLPASVRSYAASKRSLGLQGDL